MKVSAYLKSKYTILLAWLVMYVILLVSFALYALPLAVVAYPFALGLLPLVCYLAVDFRREKEIYHRLKQLEKDVAVLQKTMEELHIKSAKRMEYYSVWAHQIKTPLAAMKLILQDYDTPLSRSLDIEVKKVEAYADMVMTYLRLDSEKTDYVFEEVSLDALIKAAVRSFSGEFILRKIALEYEEAHRQILTDKKWLTFVLEQLLSNALKYTVTGSVSIFMADDNTLVIKDTGMGIAAEDLPRVFDWGFTGYNGRTQQKASGIGLYLCKRICDGLNHGISMDSKPAEGTMVSITFNHRNLTKV